MGSPATKEQMVTMVREAYEALDALIADLPEARLAERGVAGDWSIKDILAHITWWQLRMLRRLNGETPPFEQPGEDHETTIQRINDEVYREHRDQTPAELLAAFHASSQRVAAAIQGYAEDFLLAHVEEIEADTWGHYAEHAASIREWLGRA